jgi:hypothetical protein
MIGRIIGEGVESPGTMDAAVLAKRQEADGVAWQAQRDLPDLSLPDP